MPGFSDRGRSPPANRSLNRGPLGVDDERWSGGFPVHSPPEEWPLPLNPPTPPTVLLADDEAHITCVVAQKLRSTGFLVVTARDGQEALDLAIRVRPAMVVTDLQMPRMSGLDLAMNLKETPSTAGIPVLMLTARGYILDPTAVARTNIKQVMGKPFSARELVKKVIEQIGAPRAQTIVPFGGAEAA
jgi:CheY-like chemotaxis protein